MNKRLQQRTDVSFVLKSSFYSCFYSIRVQDSDNLWWDGFATEFFDDDATLTIAFCLEDGPKRYSKSCVFATLNSETHHFISQPLDEL